MPLCSSTKMLKEAQAAKIAIGAFNIENMEMAQAVISAAEEAGCPVILQTTSGTAKYAPMEVIVAIVTALAEKASVPVALHLDHSNEALIQDALKAGYTSVMYDGSKETYEENIRRTKLVVETAARQNVPVEAELGSIGGKEDDVEGEVEYTDPQMAADFAAQTGVDSLAVAIGTAHGVYKSTPTLDVQRLKEISKLVKVPLVLHGGSGLSTEDLQSCIRAGICKVNFGTDLRIAYTQGIREYMDENPQKFDPRNYGSAGRAKVQAIAAEKLAIVSKL